MGSRALVQLTGPEQPSTHVVQVPSSKGCLWDGLSKPAVRGHRTRELAGSPCHAQDPRSLGLVADLKVPADDCCVPLHVGSLGRRHHSRGHLDLRLHTGSSQRGAAPRVRMT